MSASSGGLAGAGFPIGAFWASAEFLQYAQSPY